MRYQRVMPHWHPFSPSQKPLLVKDVADFRGFFYGATLTGDVELRAEREYPDASR